MYEHLKDWGNVILRAAIIITVLFFFFWPVRLEGSSMEPTLQDGDLVCVSRFMTLMNFYDKGDLVMFQFEDKGIQRTVLKRVIATQGDQIRLFADGTVAINGAVVEEAYIEGTTLGLVDMTVPKGTVFVMGDNREVSFDSRQMGPIASKDLVGKVLVRWYPFGKMTIY